MEITVLFEKGRDGATIAKVKGKVAFPRGFTPRPGDRYEVQVVGESRNGRALFVSPIRFVENVDEARAREKAREHQLALDFANAVQAAGKALGVAISARVNDDIRRVEVIYEHQYEEFNFYKVRYEPPDPRRVAELLVIDERQTAWWFKQEEALEKECAPVLAEIRAAVKAFGDKWGRVNFAVHRGRGVTVRCACPADRSRGADVAVVPPQDKFNECLAEAQKLPHLVDYRTFETDPDMYDWEGSGYERLTSND